MPGDRLERLYADLRGRGLNPWLGLKEILQLDFLRVFYRLPGSEEVVLQGGGALHFAYGSPRLSVDLDFVHQSSRLQELVESSAEQLRRCVESDIGLSPDIEITRRGERLMRAKVRAPLGRNRVISCSLEFYRLRSLQPQTRPLIDLPDLSIRVESPSEILADKIVANLDRARRGFLKMRDVYDIWFLRERLGQSLDMELVREKLADYGVEAGEEEFQFIGVSLRYGVEELESSLRGYLPAHELEGVRAEEIIRVAAELFDECRGELL